MAYYEHTVLGSLLFQLHQHYYYSIQPSFLHTTSKLVVCVITDFQAQGIHHCAKKSRSQYGRLKEVFAHVR